MLQQLAIFFVICNIMMFYVGYFTNCAGISELNHMPNKQKNTRVVFIKL